MEKYYTFIIAVGIAIVIVGGIFAVYQLFRLVETDAECRGLKHPKFWGIFAVSGNGQSGLILYLIGRRKYPVIAMSDEQKLSIERCKKKFGVGIIFQVIGAMICVWGIVLAL